MNIADIVFGIGVFWAALRGWRKGLVRSLTSLAGLLLAYLFSVTYGALAASWVLGRPAEEGDNALLVGFIAVFLATLIAAHFAGRILQKAIRILPLGLFDSLGGSAAGLAKGILLLGLATLLLLSHPPHQDIPEVVHESTLGRPVQQGALLLLDAIKSGIPTAAAFYDRLGFRMHDTPQPPIVEEITQKADAATAQLDSLVEESRKRLETD